MPDTVEGSIHAAELAIFERKTQSLDAASAAGLPGRFHSLCVGGLRTIMATADPYRFLNAVEGLDDQSVEFLPAVLKEFPGSHQPTLVATTPSQNLIGRLMGDGYAAATLRPIAYLRLSANIQFSGITTNEWQIREVSTKKDGRLFLNLLDAGYAASSEVAELIRAEHALPTIRGFVAARGDRPLAAAAMSSHSTGAVFGGATTLPAARGTGAQSALLAYRLQLAKTLGIPLVTATAAPGAPSIRNLARLGFTIVERTAWRLRPSRSA